MVGTDPFLYVPCTSFRCGAEGVGDPLHLRASLGTGLF